MRKLNVLFRKEDLDATRIAEKDIVVLDILFATTTIVAALSHGASAVIPARSPEEARLLASDRPADSYLLAGELMIKRIEGFAPPTPLALFAQPLRGRTLIYSTTNGTVALNAAAGAKKVWVGSLLNGTAIARAIAADGTEDTVIVLCSGSMGAYNLEDYYGAGYIVSRLIRYSDTVWHLTDAARTALYLFEHWPPEACLFESRVGRLAIRINLADEVRYAARLDAIELAPIYADGEIRAATVPAIE